MKTYVKALPVHEIVRDLAENFEIPTQEDGDEIYFELSETLGTGFIRGASFSSGLGILEFHCTFFEDLEIHFVLNRTHPLKFIFCSEGKIAHNFEDDDVLHTIETYQNVIVSSSGFNGHVLHFKENETVHVFSLEIIRDLFKTRGNHGYEGLEPALQELFKDTVAEKHFFYQGNYSIKSADIVEDISEKRHQSFLRSVFLEGKAYEMLTEQIDQYHDDKSGEKGGTLMRRSDVEKVKRAVELINSELHQNFSVDHLAKEVGTNVNKLQEGFKYLFNLTVNKYMQQVKLETAKNLLSSSDYNISQIVSMIGLNNRSYFSKIFKEKYGVSPKYFLHQKNESENEEDSEADDKSQD